MAYNLGSAYIQVVPTTKGFGKNIERELSGVGARAGSSKGNSLGGKLWGGLKAGAIGAGVAIGGVLTGSVVKGFRRLTAIEDAEAKLRGLGNSAEDVQAIMDNALAAVKGTAFGMDEAATTAASAVAAGIKPGEELESYLRLVGDAAAIAGTDMASMGSIFNKVATSGKVQGDVFAQLGDAGIPIVTLLAEELGKSAEEVYKLGASGDIGTADFLAAMEAVGGSALEMGDTTSGAWRNMGAAMSRFGATLLSEVYPYIAPLLTRVTELFDYLGDKAGPAIERVMGSFKAWAQSDQVQGFMGRLRDVAVELYEKALVPLWERALKPFGEWWLREAPKFLPTIAKLGGVILALVGVITGAALGAVLASFMATVAFTTAVLWPAIDWAFKHIANAAMWLWENAIKPAWAWIRGAIAVVVDWLTGTAWPTIQRVWNAISSGVNTVRDFVTAAWARIQASVRNVVSWFQTWVWPVISLVLELTKRGFNAMRDSLRMVWMNVQMNIIRPVLVWFQGTAWPMISGVLDRIKAGFNLMRDVLRTAWNTIRDNIIAPVANWFRDKIEPLFKRATDSTGSAFTAMRDTIKKAWDGIKDAAKAPVRFVVDTVINSALIGNFNKLAENLGTKKLPTVSLPSGFARGGILPGMSRMRDGDDQLVPMRRGEGVLVSEGLRTREDRAAFMAANAAGRRGIGFASLFGGGFAGGGIFDKAKDVGGHVLDKIKTGASWVMDALSDPKAAFKGLVDKVVGDVPGAGLLRDAAIGVPKKLAGAIADKVLGAFGPGSDAFVGDAPAGASRSLGYARQVASAYGLTMTSFRRPGARTAGSGSLSLHAQGRAMDFSNSSGPTPQMMAFFNAMHPLKPTELLYSPAGRRQWRRGGRMADTSGSTRRGHFNHVHVGFAEGGIFDQGGLLQPGMTGINLTRKPEAVLDPAQTRAYQAHAEAVASDRPVALSSDDRALLRAIAEAVDFKVDGRSVVSTVRDSFKQARMPLVTA